MSASAPARGPVAACALALALLAGAAQAQVRVQETTPGRFVIPPPGLAQTLISPSSEEAPRYSRTPPALSAAQAERLRRAMELRLSGLPDRARDTLALLLRDVPHHPMAVTELARVHGARGDWNALAALGRNERLFHKDSLLVSRELALALERLGRVRDAAQIAAESWAASPREGSWAQNRMLALSPADPRGVAETLRGAVARRPGRADMAGTLAVMLSHMNQPVESARVLAAADRATYRPPLRQRFADEALANHTPSDSLAALEALVSLAADSSFLRTLRVNAAEQAFGAATAGGTRAAMAPRLVSALSGVAPRFWGGNLLMGLARALRESGRTAEANALLEREPDLAARVPELAQERLLARLRQGPPEAVIPPMDSLARRWPAGMFMLAEAEFFSGSYDSALAHYDRVARDPEAADQLLALERYYLIDEDSKDPALAALGRQAYAVWRGDAALARAIADSLHRAIPGDSRYRASAALAASAARAEQRDLGGALAAALAVADSLPADRLAPVARQRAGELLLKMNDPRRALAQFEECLARYPRAWNAPEVRRRVERLRKETRL